MKMDMICIVIGALWTIVFVFTHSETHLVISNMFIVSAFIISGVKE